MTSRVASRFRLIARGGPEMRVMAREAARRHLDASATFRGSRCCEINNSVRSSL
ncbi:hypothetical protein NXC14_PA00403 (plasmid) [Rhizobium sp. NXC14]|nr:hypothetical protein NXC14_PA00403 [Rhizobium sp. NXC14]